MEGAAKWEGGQWRESKTCVACSVVNRCPAPPRPAPPPHTALPRPAPTAPPPQVLDFGLNHANSAVVMATAKLFLHYTLAPAFAAQHRQVLESLKDPLQTLVQGREPEVVYGVLANVRVLARRYPAAFSQLYPEVRVCACVWTVGFWGGGVRGGILVVGRCSQLWCKVYWGGRGEGFGLVGRSPC